MVNIKVNFGVKMKFLVMFLFITVKYVRGSDKLNDMEYNRMPPIYQLDNYKGCLQGDGDVYCTTHFSLVSDTSNELLALIQEYSKDTATHFNHSNLRYGVCLAESCGNYYTKEATVSAQLLEMCLNRTFHDQYNLQTRVTEFTCNKYNETVEDTFGDYFMGLIIFTLSILATFATFFDVFLSSIKLEDHPILFNFSIRKNWRLLTALDESQAEGNIFKSLHGVRVLLIILVILGHSGVPHVTTMQNTKLLEESYNDMMAQVFFNGNIIVQAYFVLSGMFFVYKMQMYNEGRNINYKLLPKVIAARWFRLVPSHAFVLLFTATWLRYTKSGPLWETAIGDEIRDCQRRGWFSLLYLNNFLNNCQCLPHTWYLAADIQLYCFGLLLYVIAKNENIRNVLLAVSFLVGLLTVAVITYIQDLDALIIVSLPNIRTFFGNYPTFEQVYRKSYTNVPTYVIGLTLGYMIYDLQNSNFKMKGFKKYRYFYWATIPACFIPILLGKLFYHGPPRDPILIRVLFAMIAKPFFALLVAILIFGFAFKYEKIYRGLFEWSGWRVPSRLSYCAYLVHFLIIELYTARHIQLTHITAYTNVVMVTGFIISSFAVALPLWLLVEAPFSGLLQYYMGKRNDRHFPKTLKCKNS